jgi:hypothetical protein
MANFGFGIWDFEIRNPKFAISNPKLCVVGVAQLVRASGCDPEGREFEPPHSFSFVRP